MSRSFASASSERMENGTAPVSDVPLTMACWARTQTSATSQAFMSLGNVGGSSGARYQLQFTSGQRIQLFCQNAAQTQQDSVADSSGSNYAINTWYHAAAVFSSTTNRTIYRDGGNSANSTVSVTVGTVNAITLGARYGGASYGLFLNGQTSHPAIWNVALTAGEIAQLAKGVAPWMIRPESLVFAPEMHGTEDPEPDRWGGYHLTGYNTPTKSDSNPRIAYPTRSRIFIPAATVGGGLSIPVAVAHMRQQRFL